MSGFCMCMHAGLKQGIADLANAEHEELVKRRDRVTSSVLSNGKVFRTLQACAVLPHTPVRKAVV